MRQVKDNIAIDLVGSLSILEKKASLSTNKTRFTQVNDARITRVDENSTSIACH